MPGPRGVRFAPPPIEAEPELRWTLLRAFAPRDAPWNEGLDAGRAHDLARRLDLVPRIASRVAAPRLSAELGDAVAREFQDDRRRAAAVGLTLSALARQVASVARAQEIPVAFLKFAALEARGTLDPGSRNACDVDVLVPPDRASAMAAALERGGFARSGLPGYEHQLPPLLHPSGLMAEVHRLVLGIRLGSSGSATLEDLRAGNFLERPEGSPADVPRRDVLLAHALVHGIAQHGSEPTTYPLLRMISDLVDLGFDESDLDPDGLVARASRHEVSPDELRAACSLSRALLAGGTAPLFASDTPEGLLLRHLLAGVLDPSYAETGRLRGILTAPTDRPRARQLAGAAVAALFPTRAQLDTIYGRPRSRWGYAFLYMVRPFDLARRLVRYGFAARRSGPGRA